MTRAVPDAFGLIVGERFKQARLSAKLTQGDVAEHLSRSRQAVSLWETGNTMPTLKEFRDLMVLYGTSSDRLIFGTDNVEADGKRALDKVQALPDPVFVRPAGGTS